MRPAKLTYRQRRSWYLGVVLHQWHEDKAFCRELAALPPVPYPVAPHAEEFLDRWRLTFAEDDRRYILLALHVWTTKHRGRDETPLWFLPFTDVFFASTPEIGTLTPKPAPVVDISYHVRPTVRVEFSSEWDALKETRSEARKRMLDAAMQQIDSALDVLEDQYEAAGYFPLRLSESTEKHARMLMRFQMGATMTALAEEFHLSRSAVSKAVHDLADRAGLDLREN